MADDLIMTGMRAVAPLAVSVGALGVGLSMTDNPVLSAGMGGVSAPHYGGGAGPIVLAVSGMLLAGGVAGMMTQGGK